MSDLPLVGVAMVALLAVSVMELLAATLPMLIVVLLVPPEERPALAALLAAVDSSRRLRLWRALRLAVIARRRAGSTGSPR